MKVVHVVPTQFGPGGILGGGERYPVELARALAPHVDCRLITFGAHPRRHRESSGLMVQVLRPIVYGGGHPAHPIATSLLPALRGVDLVHTHHMRSAPSRMAAVAARLFGARTAVTDHGLQGGDWYGALPHLFDRFLTVSAYSARELGSPPARTRVIFGGVDPDRFTPDPEARRQGVLFVGRLTPHKGIDRLIQALPPSERLLIAGSEGHDQNPPEREYPHLLRRLAQNGDVSFLGPVPDDALPALYRQAAVLALPSVQTSCYGKTIAVSELLGLVVLEAMASGTPVVASRLGGIPEIVRHGVTGYLVEPGNVEELRERLTELLWNPRLAERMGKNGREVVRERFTWEACARRCLDAYEELLGPLTSGFPSV